MNSIARIITSRDLLAQLRLERQKHKGVFFLMEGASDIKRFEKFVDRANVSVVVCWGKPNVVDTVDMAQQNGDTDVLGFVDADFERVSGKVEENDDLIHSVAHDFDIDVCRTEAADRYLREMAVKQRLAAEGGSDAVVASLMDALRPLSAMRYANERHKLGYSLKRVDLDRFFDGAIIDRDAMVKSVSGGRLSDQQHRVALRAHVDNYAAADIPAEQFTNGHDLIAAMGIALRARLADRAVKQTCRDEVEKHLRLAFDHMDFTKCGLAERISAWQAAEARPPVLRLAA